MLPTTTHQQFAVLDALHDGSEHWGRDVRAAIKKDGYKSTNQSFYELMDRMESGGLVVGKYADRDVLGQMFRERCYQITGAGVIAWENAVKYYLSKAGQIRGTLGVI
jgi:DNA-binding PadR family transcriptional regulator